MCMGKGVNSIVSCMTVMIVFVFIMVQIKPAPIPEKEEKRKNVDEEMYPEYYRKCSDHIKGSNEMTPKPFRIARILYITSKKTGKGLEATCVFLIIIDGLHLLVILGTYTCIHDNTFNLT